MTPADEMLMLKMLKEMCEHLQSIRRAVAKEEDANRLIADLSRENGQLRRRVAEFNGLEVQVAELQGKLAALSK